MRKRKLIMAIIGLELLAIPAAALLMPEKVLGQTTNIIAAEIESPPGLKRYFVTSDGGFQISGKNLDGVVRVLVSEQGQIGPVEYGGFTQLPGPRQNCLNIDDGKKQIIYEADRPVLTQEADAISQAVLFMVVYDQALRPEIEFHPKAEDQTLAYAKTCS